jgi:hypothetical protein
VCELENPHPDDVLFGQLLAATAAPSAAPPRLHVVFVLTRLLTDSHPLVMRALMVCCTGSGTTQRKARASTEQRALASRLAPAESERYRR